MNWPTIEEQEAYWLAKAAAEEDHGGNVVPDRIEANQDIYPCENGHDIGFNGFCHRCGEEQPSEEDKQNV